jgi:hypothetical protein
MNVPHAQEIESTRLSKQFWKHLGSILNQGDFHIIVILIT